MNSKTAAVMLQLSLAALQQVLDAAKKNQARHNIIENIQAAIGSLAAVQGTDVTYKQLEDLRVKPLW